MLATDTLPIGVRDQIGARLGRSDLGRSLAQSRICGAGTGAVRRVSRACTSTRATCITW